MRGGGALERVRESSADLLKQKKTPTGITSQGLSSVLRESG
jgi:hypothetical protein